MTVLLKAGATFNAAYFGGAPTSTLVPSVYPVAIDGRPYQVVWDKDAVEVWGAKYKSNAIPLLRSQADASATPGEQSISPENFWRRSQENWISGAGQFQQDRNTSIATRFYTSKGIDPWTPYQLSLLNATSLKKASANTGLQVIVNGTSVYMIDGTALNVSTDAMATWNPVTGITGTPLSICSDGTTVYVSTATALYTVSGTTATSYVANSITLVGYVKGRLMAANGVSLYNITSGALPSALIAKATGWTWVGFAGGQSQIYAAGYSGDKSLIYRTAIKADGTALDSPIVAGELPDGEIIRSISSYLGYVLIGSDLGARFCSVATDGSLQIGALITTTSPVYCFEGQDRFIWYGLSNYDAVSTGLGRMDLTTFTLTLTPAYASDLMATGTTLAPLQGTVRSVKTLSNYRIFTVDGKGLYAETIDAPVSTGVITTGWINYSISDPKVALYADIMHLPLNGTVSVSFASDNSSMTPVGTSAAQGTTSPGYSLQTNQTNGLQFQLQITLTPTANVSPRLTRWTLRSYPAPARSSQFFVPVILTPSITVKGGSRPCDVVVELAHLRSLLKNQQVVSYQEGNDTFQVVMFDYQWLPNEVTKSGVMQGIFLAVLNEITG